MVTTKETRKPALRVSHIWLYVKNIQRSIQFYRDTLDLKVVEAFPDGALLNAGGILIGIHREEADRKSQPGGTSIILHTQSIEKSFKMLRKRGIGSLKKIESEPYGRIATFKDPDGYLLELWQPS
ncbi:MAG TPA: VOC family protein [Candidatus Angelobacter sp.]|nr:VOC family protein [Candidatus Angelobacter sp.]